MCKIIDSKWNTDLKIRAKTIRKKCLKYLSYYSLSNDFLNMKPRACGQKTDKVDIIKIMTLIQNR